MAVSTVDLKAGCLVAYQAVVKAIHWVDWKDASKAGYSAACLVSPMVGEKAEHLVANLAM